MSGDQLRIAIVVVLLVHGLGHGGAIGALWWIAARPDDPTGGWGAAQSWVLPSLAAADSTRVAIAFWLTSMLGFISAALALAVLPTEAWRFLAIGSALVSLVGMVLFAGTWPVFNTVAALAVNVAILAALLGQRWPPLALLGK